MIKYMTLYRDILKQAFRTSWRHKYLWFFGLFAALLGNGGELELVIRGFDGQPEKAFFPGFKSIIETGVFSKQTLLSLKTLITTDPFGLFMLLSALLILLCISGFLIWIMFTSQGALVTNVAKDKLGRGHNFRSGLEAGMKNFWPVFGLNFILRVITYTLFIIMSIPIVLMVKSASYAIASIGFIASFVLFVPLTIILSFIAKYAIAFVVLRGVGIGEAIKEGWDLFIKNWLISLEMAFTLFFLNFAVGIVLVLALLILMIPFFLMVALLSGLGIVYFTSLLIMSMAVIMIGLIALTGAWLANFQIATWTGLFIELVGRGGVSKLVRIFGGNK
jgi:hypothetical protein